MQLKQKNWEKNNCVSQPCQRQNSSAWETAGCMGNGRLHGNAMSIPSQPSNLEMNKYIGSMFRCFVLHFSLEWQGGGAKTEKVAITVDVGKEYLIEYQILLENQL